MVRNSRKYVWFVVAAFLGRSSAFLVMEILEHKFGVAISQELFLKVIGISTFGPGVIGFILGIIFDKRLKYLEECYRIDFDRRSLFKLFFTEAGILLLIVIASIVMNVMAYMIADVHLWPFF